MRLSREEIQGIKNALSEIDNKAVVYLFGSRVDDNKKGGDIDLLVFSKDMSFEKKLELQCLLLRFLGDQKIDVVIASERNKNFVNYIKQEAILL
jgi:predicted nucleotidyltransferase